MSDFNIQTDNNMLLAVHTEKVHTSPVAICLLSTDIKNSDRIGRAYYGPLVAGWGYRGGDTGDMHADNDLCCIPGTNPLSRDRRRVTLDRERALY